MNSSPYASRSPFWAFKTRVSMSFCVMGLVLILDPCANQVHPGRNGEFLNRGSTGRTLHASAPGKQHGNPRGQGPHWSYPGGDGDRLEARNTPVPTTRQVPSESGTVPGPGTSAQGAIGSCPVERSGFA